MKEVLFVHDGPIYRSDEGNYFGVDYNTDLKNRYLYLGDKVTFLMRVKHKSEDMKLSNIEGTNLNVVAVPDFKKIPQYISNRKEANRIIKNEVNKHDLIVIRLPSSIGFEAYRYAQETNKPYIIELVSCPWDGYFQHSLMGKMVAPYMYFQTRNIVYNSPFVLYVSSSFLQKRYPTMGKELSCSDVILPEMDESLLAQRLDKINRKKKDDIYILGTVGALNMKYKGQQYVIYAIKALKAEGYLLEYHLVGGGDKSYLKSLVKKLGLEENIKFIGTISHDKVFDFMKEIDIYIQPSNVESHGRVIVEAMSVACPVIGSSTGGIPELVDENYVFERKNVEDLIQKIKNMLNNLEINAENNFKKAVGFHQCNLDKKRNEYYDEFFQLIGDYND